MQKQKLSKIDKIQLSVMAILSVAFIIAMVYGHHVQNNVNTLVN